MGGRIKTYNHPGQKMAAAFMIALLLWLTVCLPIVSEGRDNLLRQDKTEKSHSPLSNTEEETSNPLTNTTEEKAPGTSSIIEEFLHHSSIVDYFSTTSKNDYNNRHSGLYIAFHGELIVPPPDAA